jgi:hypothetical protein
VGPVHYHPKLTMTRPLGDEGPTEFVAAWAGTGCPAEPTRLSLCSNIMKGIHDDFRTDYLTLDEHRASQ